MNLAPQGDPAAFVRANTAVLRPPLVPEIAFHLACEAVPIWQATEAELAEAGLPPPFWAFAWAGGQALARYLLDHPETAAGKRVLDFAAGSGLQGIAAVMAGAARVEAAEIDRFAIAAIALNGALNGVTLESVSEDLVGTANRGWDLVLAGDVCDERPLAARIEAWLKALAAEGAEVLLGDPRRTYLPTAGLERVTAYSVKTTRELEDTDVRSAVVWRVTS